MSSTDMLYKLVDCVPYMLKLVSADLFIGIFDKEKCIDSFMGGNIDLGIQKGDPVNPGSVAVEAMEKNEVIRREVSKEVYGVPYIGRGVPVTDKEGNIIGAISVAESTETKEKLQGMAEDLSSSMEQINSSIQEVASNTEKASEMAGFMDEIAKENRDNVEKIDGIIELISKIAKQTKMLGLNASIEAARAGSGGSGFQVVASEVGKLAEESAKSAGEINEILEIIKSKNLDMSEKSGEISDILEQLAAAIQEIYSTSETLNNNAGALYDMSKKLE